MGITREGRQHAPVSFSLFITLTFALLLGILITLLAFQAYQEAIRMALSQQKQELRHVRDRVQGAMDEERANSAALLRMIGNDPLQDKQSWAQRRSFLPLWRKILILRPSIEGLFMQWQDGDLFTLSRIDRPAQPPHWLLTEVESDGATQTRILFDDDLNELSREQGPITTPRLGARLFARLQQSQQPLSLPLNKQNDKIDATLATLMATRNGEAVMGLGSGLAVMRRALEQAYGDLDGNLLVIDTRQLRLIYGNHLPAGTLKEGEAPPLASLPSPLLQQLARELARPGALGHPLNRVTLPDGQEWRLHDINTEDNEVSVLLAYPMDRLEQKANRVALTFTLPLLLYFLLALPCIWWCARRISRPLQGLTAELGALGQFRLDAAPLARYPITELDALSVTITRLKDALRHFINIGEAMASRPSFEALLQQLLDESCQVLQARGGAIALQEESGFRILTGRWEAQIITAPDETFTLTQEEILSSTEGRLLPPSEAQWQRLRFLVPDPGPCLLAMEPLKDHLGNWAGVMIFVLPDTDTERLHAGLNLLRALAGNTGSALLTQRLIHEQKALLDALVQLVAGAVDAKSPHTGGHCRRVPELAMALARAASESRQGELATFRPGPREWEAIELASWLHDCGKITTPEYVMDKSTKLETLHNRIHEVRTRFEVLKRDALITALEGGLDASRTAAARREVAQQWRQLDEEFAFVARCNLGQERMDETAIARLGEIAGRSWLRTLDDRLGLSDEELSRHPPPHPLPVREPLLADRPEQRIPYEVPAVRDPRFALQPPPWLYDRGELHNLTIGAGTLTREERYKINEHIIQTIRMLEALPFPQHLKGVPAMAGGHHERMDGRGYPCAVPAGELDLCTRIIALADVFEALTASDRPYKQPKSLSQALTIMQGMVKGGHLDPTLFALFVRSGLWREYGRRYLSAAQQDEVDTRALLEEESATASVA
ncbi:hypothetical protein ATO46_19025 [Aeromonas schubertii]|uniref:HD domain-containing phosphohydrolase n=1 Tax=Aeromonas schubertii TaxID=652 RepID=UPI00067F5F9E|nr:HD domain-containing phosphohydrolase [Aeromonas schubertii]KUE79263.1 hypothetical protein ATO46_19025 [Aeromonas schubertii]